MNFRITSRFENTNDKWIRAWIKDFFFDHPTMTEKQKSEAVEDSIKALKQGNNVVCHGVHDGVFFSTTFEVSE